MESTRKVGKEMVGGVPLVGLTNVNKSAKSHNVPPPTLTTTICKISGKTIFPNFADRTVLVLKTILLFLLVSYSCQPNMRRYGFTNHAKQYHDTIHPIDV